MTLSNKIRNIWSQLTMKWLLVMATLLTPFLFYFDTARSIVSIWDSSETFAHGYIILPISIWLIWRRREVFAQLSPAPFWPGLLLLSICGFGWLLAELGGVQVVSQYAFVAMIPVAALTLLGWRISARLTFPLLFLLFAVPFGEIFIDPLINITADFTVTALQLTGIPVLREGNSFSIPSGNWSVVEACSGVRYLIASITLGSLYAYLSYRSRFRQALFILSAIIVPIIANGIRAYMIVMIGHLSGMTLAVGFDHIIYGWIFFGLVMFIMFWIGSFWREELQTPVNKITERNIQSPHSAISAHLSIAALMTAVCIAMWPLYANYLERKGSNPVPVDLSSFKSQWQDAPSFTKWLPYYSPGNAEFQHFYQKGNNKAGIFIRYYRNQHQGSELISSSNRLVQNDDPIWNRLSVAVRNEEILHRIFAVRETKISGPSGNFLVWSWYWIHGKLTVSDYTGKMLQAKNKLMLQGDDAASIMVIAPYDVNPDTARAMLSGFLTDNQEAVYDALASNLK